MIQRYVDCLTKSTAWPLISTFKNDVEVVLSMGVIFDFFQLIGSPNLEAVDESVSNVDLRRSDCH